MSDALPGMHYCKLHQGNTSHYDPINCFMCKYDHKERKIREYASYLMHSTGKGISRRTVVRKLLSILDNRNYD